jgi:NADH-quinone oxidoreductase subunit C
VSDGDASKARDTGGSPVPPEDQSAQDQTLGNATRGVAPDGGLAESASQRAPRAETPSPEPKSTADGSAANADPAGTIDAVAAPENPGVGGSQTAPTATQEGAVSAEAPLANIEAMRARMDLEATAATDGWGRGAYVDPDVEKHPVVRALRERYPDAIVDIVRFRDETTIHVRRELLREICAYLRDHQQIALDFLSDVTAVDMLRLRETPRFDVVVQLYSLRNRVRVRLKAGCNDGESVPSLVPLWNGANWLEREAYDMFGIVFEGHPNLRRMLLPDEWDEGHPLRKDYPLRGWSEFPVYNTERTVPRTRTRWTGRGV